MPETDWRLIKAQLCAESNLNPNATSPVGAMGIAQFMPATWEQMRFQLEMPVSASAYSHIYAIPACAYYMSELTKKWHSPRPEADRYCLALASYNAGMGNILKAQKLADMATDYHSIITRLPDVTGENATETIEYVKRIFAIWGEYLLSGR